MIEECINVSGIFLFFLFSQQEWLVNIRLQTKISAARIWSIHRLSNPNQFDLIVPFRGVLFL